MRRRGLLLTAKLAGRLAVLLAAFLAGLSAAELSAPRGSRPHAPCEAARDLPREDVTDAARSWAAATPTRAPSFFTSLPGLRLTPEGLRAAWQVTATPAPRPPAAREARDGRKASERGGEAESR